MIDKLFGAANALGQGIRIKHVPFTVVGVLERKGQSPTGQDQDDVILVPIATAKRKVLGTPSANADAVGSIMMQATNGDRINAAQDEAQALPPAPSSPTRRRRRFFHPEYARNLRRSGAIVARHVSRARRSRLGFH